MSDAESRTGLAAIDDLIGMLLFPHMPTDQSSNADEHSANPAMTQLDLLLAALKDWLAVLDNSLAGELNAEQREQLANGAAELRALMSELSTSRDTHN